MEAMHSIWHKYNPQQCYIRTYYSYLIHITDNNYFVCKIVKKIVCIVGELAPALICQCAMMAGTGELSQHLRLLSGHWKTGPSLVWTTLCSPQLMASGADAGGERVILTWEAGH